MSGARPGPLLRLAVAAYGTLLLAVGIALAIGGFRLVTLGGSWYYLYAGLALVAIAILVFRWRGEAAWLYGALLLLSLVWAIQEVGFDGWALAPRLIALAVVGLGLLIPSIRRGTASPPVAARRAGSGRWRRLLAPVVASTGAVTLGAVLHALGPPRPADPVYRVGMVAPPPAAATMAAPDAAAGDWPYVGSDPGGTRFSRLVQIAPGNVGRLQVAWTYRTGDPTHELEVTPLKVGDLVYLCTGTNDVIALDAETGAERWRFDAGAAGAPAIQKVCRGVAFYRVPDAAGACATRIITNTIDARLIALDARSGQPCSDFGTGGQVRLLAGMGDALGRIIPGYYFVTSAPTIVRGRIVVGGWVSDLQYWGEPSGVIRAFDAVTGQFAWAFDVGRPDRRTEPPAGEHYTPSTPNSWAPMSADEESGLVYAPTGNATGSDYYGVLRRPFDEKYSSSVVALDAATGEVRWSFQTVHHDLWDYDVASQPVLVDLPRPGGVARALIQATKMGEIFVLDRTTGQPLFEVVEAPVPTRGAIPAERVSPTQPLSKSLPAFRGPEPQERDMWGLTPIDQLWCRIEFRRARYEGLYTPPGPTPSLQYPGILGGINWGSVSVDPERGLMIVNASRMANYVRLVPRAEADALGRKPESFGGRYMDRAAFGTPFAVSNPWFMSGLRVPCMNPPFGTVSAVDLATGRLVWTQRLGTARESGPRGIPSMLPVPLGTPNVGGSLATRSGLVFIGAAQDRYLRAFEARTGRMLWRARLPAAGLATPMTYVSPASGRQFVVVAAGGGHNMAREGDYVIAYALPR